MQHAALLVAVHRSQLGIADGQVAVAVEPALVDQDVPRAVHGLDHVLLLVDGEGVHVFLVVIEVPGRAPQVVPRQVGDHHQLVAAAEMLVLPEVLDEVPDQGALGMPVDESRPRAFLDGIEVEFAAQPAVVPLAGLLQERQVRVQLRLGREGGAVDALELRPPLVAAPVGAGDGQQFEHLERAARRHVGAEAEIVQRVQPVARQRLGGLLVDELALERLAHLVEDALRLRQPDHRGFERQVARGQLPHLLLDPGQVLLGQGVVHLEVVVEAVLGGGADAQVGAGKQVQHGQGHEVGGAVAQNGQGFGGIGHDATRAVALDHLEHGWIVLRVRCGNGALRSHK